MTNRPLLGFAAEDGFLCSARDLGNVKKGSGQKIAAVVCHSRALSSLSSNSAAMSPMRRFSFIARRRSQR